LSEHGITFVATFVDVKLADGWVSHGGVAVMGIARYGGLSARGGICLVDPALRTGLWDFGPVGLSGWIAGELAVGFLLAYVFVEAEPAPTSGALLVESVADR
jgi:hypothetical protein